MQNNDLSVIEPGDDPSMYWAFRSKVRSGDVFLYWVGPSARWGDRDCAMAWKNKPATDPADGGEWVRVRDAIKWPQHKHMEYEEFLNLVITDALCTPLTLAAADAVNSCRGASPQLLRVLLCDAVEKLPYALNRNLPEYHERRERLAAIEHVCGYMSVYLVHRRYPPIMPTCTSIAARVSTMLKLEHQLSGDYADRPVPLGELSDPAGLQGVVWVIFNDDESSIHAGAYWDADHKKWVGKKQASTYRDQGFTPLPEGGVWLRRYV